MEIIRADKQFKMQRDAAICIGKFDGVHLGHRILLQNIIDKKKQGMMAAVVTFDPSPEVFFGGRSAKELSTREEKKRLFERMGIDAVIELPFNAEVAATPPELFIKNILVEQMNMKFVAAGPDLSYGDKGKGNFELLEQLADRYGYETMMIPKETLDGKVISSTYCRALVEEGKMEEAHKALGEPYKVIGIVQHGKALGRTIDIPTVNQIPEPEKLLPPFGVYYSRVNVNGVMYNGMTNIGVKPTVTDEKRVTIETYIYDFKGDLYGQDIETSLLNYRRPEMRFSGIDELKATMQSDLAAGREFFAKA